MYSTKLFKRHSLSVLISIACIAIGCCMISSKLYAATMDVTTVADALNNDGNCSLREAIINSNNNALTYVDCPASGPFGADTINVPAGTYTLTVGSPCEDQSAQGDLDIQDSLSILGAGADSTIVQMGAAINDRVIDIPYPLTTSFPIDVNIRDLTIRGGKPGDCGTGTGKGGGIQITRYDGNLYLTRVVVTQNSAGLNDGASDGGGIYSSCDTVTINQSTISENTALWDQGGGMACGEGIVTIINSTLSGNTAEDHGGGIYLCGDISQVNLRNATITNNTTNTGDGGGISAPCQVSQFNVRNTIIAGNTDNSNAFAPDCFSVSQTEIISEGYNLIGDNRGCVDGVNASWLATDQIGDVAGGGTAINPLLGALADNGGTTPTHALDIQSPAVDMANSVEGCTSDDAMTVVLTVDQRQEPRPVDVDGDGNVVCDVGAFELQPACGDGVIQGDEECDNGAENSDSAADACRTDCTLASCGDGVVDTGEECDDGNNEDWDGCASDCTLEGACGDGIVQSGEECDDGNTVNGDGCSSTCIIEFIRLQGDGGCSIVGATMAPVHYLGLALFAGAIVAFGLIRRRSRK